MSQPLDRRSFLKLGAFAALAGSRPAMASFAPERSLTFYNLHTSERLNTVYWAEGAYIPEALQAINYHLRDYRTGEIREIDRRLLDVLCELRRKLETTAQIELISGYRSPSTNAMLHGKSPGVAEHSLHIEGMAADIRIPGRNLSLLRKAAVSMKAGGVGYYPASQFVHVDVGRVRTW
jgi:uncharacterized protein YcbK (DUF882 family)